MRRAWSRSGRSWPAVRRSSFPGKGAKRCMPGSRRRWCDSSTVAGKVWQGTGAALPGADDRSEPCAGDAAHHRIQHDGAGESGGVSAEKVRYPLHGRRRRPAGLRRQSSWELERAGDPANSRARVRRVWASGLRPAWPQSRWRTCTGSATRWLTGNAIPATSRHGPRQFRSASGANHNRRARLDTCVSTPCIRAIKMAARVSITSMPSIR